jgi:RNA polymerase sigma-70 factor (ECF subfamily)
VTPSDAAPGRFATTHWSVVLAARARGEPQAEEALSALCRTYWYPLYAYIRRRGHSAEDAQDLTQAFFTRLLEKNDLAQVDPQKGRFRSFLLAACNHFLSNERDRQKAQKRGGGRAALSLDWSDAEGRYLVEPADGLTPERLFERRWALTLLDQVLTRLRAEYAERGKEHLFDALRGAMAGEPDAASYRDSARQLGLSEGAVKVAIHRLRQRYRELLRDEIGRTVGAPEQIDDEVRDLFAALAADAGPRRR